MSSTHPRRIPQIPRSSSKIPYPPLFHSLPAYPLFIIFPPPIIPSIAAHNLQPDDVSFEQMVDESERLKCLSAAITCAVLAPAGPQRSRILATLYKDERASQNLPTDFAILEKMHFLRLLSPVEVGEFAKSLAPHQLALLPGDGGSQVLPPFGCVHHFSLSVFFYLFCYFWFRPWVEECALINLAVTFLHPGHATCFPPPHSVPPLFPYITPLKLPSSTNPR